jgi:hypothetical protein
MIGTLRDDNAIENGDPYCLRTAFAHRHQRVGPLRDRTASSKGEGTAELSLPSRSQLPIASSACLDVTCAATIGPWASADPAAPCASTHGQCAPAGHPYTHNSRAMRAKPTICGRKTAHRAHIYAPRRG